MKILSAGNYSFNAELISHVSKTFHGHTIVHTLSHNSTQNWIETSVDYNEFVEAWKKI